MRGFRWGSCGLWVCSLVLAVSLPLEASKNKNRNRQQQQPRQNQNNGQPRPLIDPTFASDANPEAMSFEELERYTDPSFAAHASAPAPTPAPNGAAAVSASTGAAPAATTPPAAPPVTPVEEIVPFAEMSLEEATKLVTGYDVDAPAMDQIDLTRESKIYLRPTLPPVVDAFFVSLLSVVEFDPTDDEEDFTRRINPQTVDPEKLLNFARVLKLTRHIYGHSKESPRPLYKGPEITSLRQFFNITEPTRGDTGTAEGDFAKLLALAERWEKDPASVPKAPVIDVNAPGKGVFFSENIKFAAALALEMRARHFQSLVMATASDASRDAASDDSVTRSIMEEVFKSFAFFLTRPGNLAMALRASHEIAQRPTMTADQMQKKARVDTTHPFMTWADKLEALDRLGRQEDAIIAVMGEIANLQAGKFWDVVLAFDEGMRGVVKELCQVGTRASRAQEFRFVRASNPTLFDTITTLFDKYPRRYTSQIKKNILIDIIRMPRDSSNYAVLKLVLKHGGPLLIGILQAQAHRDDLGPFAEVFRDLQGDNLPAPFAVIWDTISQDVNHYGPHISAIDPISTTVGKSFQCHHGYYEGKEVAIRVKRPGIEELLDVELNQILLPLAPELGAVILPPGGDPRTRRARAERLIRMMYREQKKEMDVELTVRNQNTARAHWMRSFNVTTEDMGQVTLEMRIPESVPALPGSNVQIMDWVGGAMKMEKFRRSYPGVAKALGAVLPEHLYEQAIFRPIAEATAIEKAKLEGTSTGDEPVPFGMSHNDLHARNIMYLPPYSRGNQAVVPFVPVDWSLVTLSDAAEMQKLLLLSFGASLNSVFAITDALWTLRVKDDDGSTSTTYAQLKAAVKKKVKELYARHQYWGADGWIGFAMLNGLLNFPDYVMGLYAAKQRVESVHSDLGNTKEDLAAFMARLEEKYRWQVVALARQRYSPVYQPHRWTQVGWSLGRYHWNRCADAIANWLRPNLKPISPLD